MRFSGSVSSVSRRALMALAMVAMVGGVAFAQDPPAAAAQPAQPPDPLKLTQDHVIILYQIKPEKAADFESGFAAIKAKLTTKPEYKEFVDTMNLEKVDAPANSQVVVYVLALHPPSKMFSYDLTKLLYYEDTKTLFDRADADAIYAKLKDAVPPGSINLLPLKKVGG